LAAVAVGASAVVLAAVPYKAFDLDRYFVPKELVLHLAALVAVIGVIVAADPAGSWRPKLTLTRTDTLLVIFLVVSLISAGFAPNGWLAARALAISISGITLFWVSQYLARLGRAGTLLVVLSAAVTMASITTLLQAYGFESEFFSINRSPGGTLGNRNFVAHLAAIGTPTLVVATLRARRTSGVVLGALATAPIAASIVLSRSRGAWVAVALALVSVLPTVVRAWRVAQERAASGSPDASRESVSLARRLGSGRLARRTAMLLVAGLVGTGAAVILPNVLKWRSTSPYLDSVLGVTNYRGGSGHGRLVQYVNTARLGVTHPVLGVGPGNWAVVYPQVASRNDPALDTDDGMTANPWPSSDWAAFFSERGIIATLCLALAFVGFVVGAWRAADLAIDDGRVDRLLPALGLIATVTALITVGAFDAVLLLAAPALIAWSILGTFSGMLDPAAAPRATVPWTTLTRGVLIGAAVLALGVATARSGAQIAAMALYNSAMSGSGGQHALELAAAVDPGSYRIRMRLAEAYAEGKLCSRVRSQAIAARALYPSAPEPRRLLTTCTRRPR
jgi:O-antigen ligase